MSSYLASFRQVRNCPPEGSSYGTAQSALNVLVSVNHSSWEFEYKALLKQVHELCLMPNDHKCIYALLAENGFFRQPGMKTRVRLEDVVVYLHNNGIQNRELIVEMYGGSGDSRFLAILSNDTINADGEQDGKPHYKILGFDLPTKFWVVDIWIRWEDRCDHSPVKRRKHTSKATMPARQAPPDHEAFHYLQKNPKEDTGDCVIRAVASTCQITWHEAIDQIVCATRYVNTTINQSSLYTQFLKQERFEKRTAMTKDGRKLTGKEFCMELDKVLLCGERVFAYIGRSHVAAVIPFIESGVTHYKIVDSWDSSSRKVGDYWIKPVSNKTAFCTMQEMELLNKSIIHPVFGSGKVRNIHASGWMGIFFEREGYRKLDSRWILQNCKICTPQK